ncbi:MAG: siroheme synthase CysG [Boseongicola sp.]|nr:siroheme synthase CysG [Boseongicola sp.]MDD9977136.1 siroheme synthase CysG [Boseongicola sp.]
MKHFPIFLNVEGRRIVVSGGGDAAVAKLKLLLKTDAKITVFSENANRDVRNFAAEGKITLVERPLAHGDAVCAALFYAANDEDAEDRRVADIARAEGALVNWVDNLENSQFITPAIVDRDPVTVAIGTEGAAPVLARSIKADLEARLPRSLGVLARAGKSFRKFAEKLPMGLPRRNFWSDYYFNAGPKTFEDAGEDALASTLDDLLTQHLQGQQTAGHVSFVGAGPGDPELLTLKARNALHEADVVIHDRLVTPEILELARREALVIDVGKEGFGPSTSQDYINELLVEHADGGAHVVRLKSGDATVFGRLDEEIDAVTDANITFNIVPGITSASAAVATIGQSLTKRKRNASVRLITGHDMKGYAEQDWRSLAAPGQVAAIYMGKKAARYVQGRLLMHGASADTPVTIVENVSRPDQRIVQSTLATLAHDIDAAALSGPALMLYGLAPRAAVDLFNSLSLPEEVAL